MTIGRLFPSRARPVLGIGVGLALVAATFAVLAPFHQRVGSSAPGFVLVIPVVVAGLFGGLPAALVVAMAATIAFSVGFIPPVGTLRVALPSDIVALLTFTAVAALVGALVATAEARRVAAEERGDQLARLHDQLTKTEVERGRLLVEAERVKALQELDRQRAALLRSVSHDLRTPLVTIRGVASDLLADAEFDASTRRRLLSLVAHEASRLDRMVGNLLAMSRIEAGALVTQLAPVALDDILASVTERLDLALAPVTLRTEIPHDLPLVRGDYAQLEQVLANLVENAIRVSPSGGAVTVSAATDGEWVRVCVRDSGPGVGDDPERLFAAFSTATPGHTGLGLAICRAIVAAHGGTIVARDADSGGAIFAFTVLVA